VVWCDGFAAESRARGENTLLSLQYHEISSTTSNGVSPLAATLRVEDFETKKGPCDGMEWNTFLFLQNRVAFRRCCAQFVRPFGFK
jgi:hypothetical protein